jgi:hypothetical protein
MGDVTPGKWAKAAGSRRNVARIGGLAGSGQLSSGPDAAMGPERSHVRRLVEQPESLPLVAGLAEVF